MFFLVFRKLLNVEFFQKNEKNVYVDNQLNNSPPSPNKCVDFFFEPKSGHFVSIFFKITNHVVKHIQIGLYIHYIGKNPYIYLKFQ